MGRIGPTDGLEFDRKGSDFLYGYHAACGVAVLPREWVGSDGGIGAGSGDPVAGLDGDWAGWGVVFYDIADPMWVRGPYRLFKVVSTRK